MTVLKYRAQIQLGEKTMHASSMSESGYTADYEMTVEADDLTQLWRGIIRELPERHRLAVSDLISGRVKI